LVVSNEESREDVAYGGWSDERHAEFYYKRIPAMLQGSFGANTGYGY
jgi:hypothetical protein